MTKEQAQQRVDQVLAFQREILELERDGALTVMPDERSRLDGYHRELLDQLAGRFDVDRSDRQRQMSLVMRIASLVGALALSAAVVLFFNRVWGLLATPAQFGVLVAAPLASLAAIDIAARREKTLYMAAIMALVATVAFILDLNVQGLIFNMRPSPNALALWSGFALLVAYTYGLRLLLAAGIGMGLAFVCAIVAKLAGLDWTAAILRPEPLMASGAIAVAAAGIAPNRRRAGFVETWRLTGCLAVLVPLLFLSTWSEVFSYWPGPPRLVGALYDVAGFVLAAAGVWVGARAGWREVVTASGGFLVVFLFAKCFDWWWLWMPRYLFFLLIGALAVAALVVIGRIRSRFRKGVA